MDIRMMHRHTYIRHIYNTIHIIPTIHLHTRPPTIHVCVFWLNNLKKKRWEKLELKIAAFCHGWKMYSEEKKFNKKNKNKKRQKENEREGKSRSSTPNSYLFDNINIYPIYQIHFSCMNWAFDHKSKMVYFICATGRCYNIIIQSADEIDQVFFCVLKRRKV